MSNIMHGWSQNSNNIILPKHLQTYQFQPFLILLLRKSFSIGITVSTILWNQHKVWDLTPDRTHQYQADSQATHRRDLCIGYLIFQIWNFKMHKRNVSSLQLNFGIPFLHVIFQYICCHKIIWFCFFWFLLDLCWNQESCKSFKFQIFKTTFLVRLSRYRSRLCISSAWCLNKMA